METSPCTPVQPRRGDIRRVPRFLPPNAQGGPFVCPGNAGAATGAPALAASLTPPLAGGPTSRTPSRAMEAPRRPSLVSTVLSRARRRRQQVEAPASLVHGLRKRACSPEGGGALSPGRLDSAGRAFGPRLPRRQRSRRQLRQASRRREKGPRSQREAARGRRAGGHALRPVGSPPP